MRSIHADLTAAQVAASRVPALNLIVENIIDSVRRLEFSNIDATLNTSGKHDACLPDDGSLTRVRMDAGTVKQQRTVAPSGSSAWGTWANFVAGMGSQVACSAKGARVVIVYTDAAGTGVRFRESTDNGATFTADALIWTAAAVVQDLAVAYKNSTGDLIVAAVTSTNLYVNKRTAGAFGGAVAWTASAASLTGVAAVYGTDWDFALTGTETASLRPSLWTLAYGDGGELSSGTWGSLQLQAQADVSTATEFRHPFLTFSDTWRMNYTEVPSYVGGQTQTFRTWIQPSLAFTQGAYTWRTPLKAQHNNINGLALCSNATVNGGYVYESGIDTVRRALRTILETDATEDVIAFDLREEPFQTRGWIDLKNDAGQYAGPPVPFQLGNSVQLQVGYYTASGNRYTKLQDLWIAALEHRRTGGVSTLRVHVTGGWEQLARNRQRTNVIHTADHYRAILSAICARAGIVMNTAGSSSRAGTVVPAFTINPQTDGRAAALNALAFLADRLIMRDGAALLTEPSATEAADYDLAGHPINNYELLDEPPALSEAHALGAGALGIATDYAFAELGIAPLERQRDLTSTGATAANATAAAHLRTRQLDRAQGEIVCPPVLALELLDVVQILDAFVSPSVQKRRVLALRWRFDAARQTYEQRITLGAM